MAKVEHITPIPTTHDFKATLTTDEIARLSTVAKKLHDYRRQLSADLKIPQNYMDEVVALLMALSPEDPLDDLTDTDDEFVMVAMGVRVP